MSFRSHRTEVVGTLPDGQTSVRFFRRLRLFRKCMLRTGINHCGVFNALAGFVILDIVTCKILNELIQSDYIFRPDTPIVWV
jgi:hypothetical protein